MDYFKEEFKRYKKRSADLREVLDSRDAKNFTGTVFSARVRCNSNKCTPL
jgi:hypothetical protein